MNPRTFLRVLALAVVAPLALLAASVRWTTPAERAAEPILERNAAARGGLAAWRAVRTMSLTGTLEAGTPRDPVKLARRFQRSLTQMKAEARLAAAHPEQAAAEPQAKLPFVMELKRPRMTRLELRFRGQTAVQVFDGTRGWKVRPFLGRRDAEPFTADELRVASQQTELDGPLLDAAAKHERVYLVGTEKLDGRETYKLEVRARGGLIRHVWVDAETWLDVKVDGTRRLDGKDVAVWTRYRDFRPEDGVLVPHLLETGVEGKAGTERIFVDHVALNPRLSDDLFTRPD